MVKLGYRKLDLKIGKNIMEARSQETSHICRGGAGRRIYAKKVLAPPPIRTIQESATLVLAFAYRGGNARRKDE
jgi:hypothetical protein